MLLPATHLHYSKTLIFLSGLIFTILIWIFDFYLLGPEITFTLIYLIPISWVTWSSGRANGVILSLISTAGWFTVYLTQNPYVSHSLLTYLNAATKLLLLQGFTYVLSALHASMKRERELSRTDPLTGVLNRRAFMDTLRTEKSRSLRSQRPVTLAFLDIDNFKAVNDTFGHATGDKLLSLTADTIHNHLRITDTVARMGGDEFAILFPEIDSRGPETAINKIKRNLLIMTSENGWPATFSFGVLTCSHPQHTPDEMLEMADHAMYAAKQSGKNRISYSACDTTSVEKVLAHLAKK